MAAVIAAIGAAFLAGAVALLREHRLQQRKLLVAARVMDATFKACLGGIAGTRQNDRWVPIEQMPGEPAFSSAWEAYKADLAGHLIWAEWVGVERAVAHFEGLVGVSKAQPPSDAVTLVSETEEKLKIGREILYPYCVARLTVRKLLNRKLKSRKTSAAPLQ